LILFGLINYVQVFPYCSDKSESYCLGCRTPIKTSIFCVSLNHNVVHDMTIFINVNAPRIFSTFSLNLRDTYYQYFTNM